MQIQSLYMFQKKDQLFRVIRILKAPEKAYLKKYAYKDVRKESEAVGLFNLIDKQIKKEDKIEEAILIKQFHKKFPNHNYTKIKSRLLHLILDTLIEYDKNKNELYKIFDLIAMSDSLSNRKLFYDAKNILEKAVKIAEDLEQIELLILIKIRIYFFNTYIQKYGNIKDNRINFKELQNDLNVLKGKVNELSAVYELILFQKSIGVPRSQADFERLDKIQNQPVFQLDYIPELNTSKIELVTGLCGIYFALGDVQSVVKIGKKFIKEFQPSPKLSKFFTMKYLSFYDSFLQGILLSLNVPLFEKYYPKFQDIKTYGADESNYKRSLNLYIQSIYAIVGKKINVMPELTKEFEQVKKETYVPNYRKVSLAYYMIFGNFLNDAYDLSLDNIQWLKDHKHLGIRYDIEIAVLTMECIIFIKKEEFDLLEYRLRSFSDFLKTRERKFSIEAAMMRLFNKIIKNVSKANFKKTMQESLLEMQQIVKENPSEKAFINAFDIISWLESELNNQAFKVIYYKNNIG